MLAYEYNSQLQYSPSRSLRPCKLMGNKISISCRYSVCTLGLVEVVLAVVIVEVLVLDVTGSGEDIV